ncbi:hypothetical protein B0H14DRAFT_2633936 [Mycena olivaceomarginata]|nr:hypothetical protein B0H14DRAFT_2633936 [Mycena olivaceomarginata]
MRRLRKLVLPFLLPLFILLAAFGGPTLNTTISHNLRGKHRPAERHADIDRPEGRGRLSRALKRVCTFVTVLRLSHFGVDVRVMKTPNFNLGSRPQNNGKHHQINARKFS